MATRSIRLRSVGQSFYATFQQLGLSIGICTGSLLMHLFTDGLHLGRAAFGASMLVTAAIAGLAVLPLRTLKPDAPQRS